MSKWTEESRVVPFTSLPLSVGRAPDCDLCLNEPTVSRRHALIFRRKDDIVVSDQGSLFGTFVNGQRVREWVLRRDDRVRFGARISYVVQENGLQREGLGVAALQVRNVSIARQGRMLVEGVSAVFTTGNLVGILGPSGLGKSLLLRVLAGYNQPEAGQVVWDGYDVWADREGYLTQVGFIPQADVLYETLSVRENLEYAARLRLPGLSESARRERIEEVLDLLQLKEHAEKRAVVLSGGQRKRLSVAIELLRKPPILLLDEPTTGLDPGNELRLMENLRQVASRGTLVVLSTHSLAALSLIDQVLVLARYGGVGRVAFCGPVETLRSRLAGMHPADWYNALEQGRVAPKLPGGQRPPDGTHGHVATATQGDLLDSWAERFPPPLVLPLRRIARRQGGAAWWHQWVDVAVRCAKGIVRDRALVAMMAVQPVLLALLVILSQGRASKIDPILFFTVVVAIWLGMNNTVRDLVRERRQYLRDRMAGLQAEAYLAAKVSLYLAIGIIQLLVFFLLVRLGCSQAIDESLAKKLSETGDLGWLTTLSLVYLCGVGLGMLVSTLSRTEEAAVASLPILILPQILLSAVATGDVYERFSDPRICRPIVVTLNPGLGEAREADRDRQKSAFGQLGWAGTVTDILSMCCYSRPALLVLQRPKVPGYSANIWLADLFHLLLLLCATHGAMWGLFLKYESRWPTFVAL
ncbi:MAG: heme ABC exporter ATP-binding protein CcmA [Thermogutta sp.]